MFIGMNRFLTKEQIERLYQIPGDILPSVMATVPVVHRGEGGEPYFVESDVDRAVDAFAGSAAGRESRGCEPARKGKPGRKNSTNDIAQYANQLRLKKKTWKEVVAACKLQFPERATSIEQVRTIWRRHFGNKK